MVRLVPAKARSPNGWLDGWAFNSSIRVPCIERWLGPCCKLASIRLIPNQVAPVVQQIDLQIDSDRIILNGRDVTASIRTPAVSQQASVVAEIPRVREVLVQLQRRIANGKNMVCEGRDQGTVAFPDAACKFFLTADAQVRARRRWQELKAGGDTMDLETVIAEQKIRDLRDETRAVGRLTKADDAVEIRVDDLSIDQVLEQMEQVVRSRIDALQN